MSVMLPSCHMKCVLYSVQCQMSSCLLVLINDTALSDGFLWLNELLLHVQTSGVGSEELINK